MSSQLIDSCVSVRFPSPSPSLSYKANMVFSVSSICICLAGVFSGAVPPPCWLPGRVSPTIALSWRNLSNSRREGERKIRRKQIDENFIIITVKESYFMQCLILWILQGGQIWGNKSLTKIDNPNTFNKHKCSRQLRTFAKKSPQEIKYFYSNVSVIFYFYFVFVVFCDILLLVYLL